MNAAVAQGFSLKDLAQDTQRPPTDFERMLSQPIRFDEGERSLILQTCCGGASHKEAQQLIAIAEARGLNPIKGECYFVKRWDSQKRVEVWAVQASIDAFRIKADETGLYDGQDEPEYEYDAAGKMVLSRVKVWRKGIGRPFVGVARYEEYVQRTKEGDPTRFWKNMPHNQLAKCAEALAFRKAFPARFAKVYTPEEMAQAENETATPPSDPLYHELWEAIESCTTLPQLRGVGARVASALGNGKLSAVHADELRALAKSQKDQIVAQQKKVIPDDPSLDVGKDPAGLAGDVPEDPDQGP